MPQTSDQVRIPGVLAMVLMEKFGVDNQPVSRWIEVQGHAPPEYLVEVEPLAVLALKQVREVS